MNKVNEMIGKNVPNVTFKTRVRDESVGGENPFSWKDLTSDEVFANKKVVVFALPGAFTPTCSSTHAPGYESKIAEFKALGVDSVICLSVNDAFVMYQWSVKLGLKDVFMLPDGNADFTREMGALVTKKNLGFGERSWRYSMLVENSEIKNIFSEEGQMDEAETDPFLVSDADTMLNYLKTL